MVPIYLIYIYGFGGMFIGRMDAISIMTGLQVKVQSPIMTGKRKRKGNQKQYKKTRNKSENIKP